MMNTTTRLVALAIGAIVVTSPTGTLAAHGQPTAPVTGTAPGIQHDNRAPALEKGHVVECVSGAPRLEAFVSMYENSRYVNVLQVVVGDPDQGMGDSVEKPDGFVHGRDAYGSLELGGEIATVTGSVVRKGPKTKVHEVIDDAGQRIVSRGWHRPLVTDLRLTYGDVTVPLSCDTAFVYHLHVRKTPITG